MKKEPGNEEGQQHFDDADKLLQEFQEAQVDRVGSRPSSNLSSLSNASERDQHHLGTCGQSKRWKINEAVKVHFLKKTYISKFVALSLISNLPQIFNFRISSFMNSNA